MTLSSHVHTLDLDRKEVHGSVVILMLVIGMLAIVVPAAVLIVIAVAKVVPAAVFSVPWWGSGDPGTMSSSTGSTGAGEPFRWGRVRLGQH
jgi:hypothetical protein